MRLRIQRGALIVSVLATVMCGPVGGPGPEVPAGMTVPGLPVPDEVTAENLDLALRRLDDLDADSAKRDVLRASIVDTLGARFDSHLAGNQLEEAAQDFEKALKTHSTEEILAGEISPVVLSMARSVRDRFSPMGDEARVMTALLVLRFGDPGDEDVEAEYELLVGWTEEARQALGDDAMRVNDLTRLYEHVAMSVPVPTVTDRLIDLYAERQVISLAAYEKMLSFQPSQGLQGLKQAAQAVKVYEQLQPKVRMTSYLVARLFTRLGTPTAALAVLDQGMDGTIKGSMQGQVHEDVMNVLEALDADPGSAQGWMALSRLLASYDDLDLARWAARRGWRLDPWGHTFPLEIGRLYEAQEDLQGAREYMELALSLDPEKPLIYQELMGLHLMMVARAMDGSDPEKALVSIEELSKLLARFQKRWPLKAVGLREADVERLRGLATFELGRVEEATAHFEKALEDGKEIRTIYHLALIHAGTRKFEQARDDIKMAQKVHFKKHGEAYYWKTVLGMLDGDILSLMNDERAAESHDEALKTGLEGLPFVPPELKPEMEARLGLLLIGMDRDVEGLDHLKRSIASGADHETYSLVLSRLCAGAEAELSDTITHFAMTDSNIPLEHKRLFALWNVALALQTKAQPNSRSVKVLEDAAGDGWPATLYGFALGTATAEQAQQQAGSEQSHNVVLGYVMACRSKGQEDRDAAVQHLSAVLEAHLVADPHHWMALQMLHELDALPSK